MKKKFSRKINFRKGFTLIELMVSTSIFMVVMLIAMGSLLVTSSSAKKSNALNFTMDNLSFAIESMSRSLRMGTNYTCSSTSINLTTNPTPSDCPNGGSLIAFIPATAKPSVRMAYQLMSRTNGSTNTIKRCETTIGNSVNCVDLISPNINIEVMKFFVRGASPSDLVQPSVYVIIKGSVIIKKRKTSFAVQTMISQRTLE